MTKERQHKLEYRNHKIVRKSKLDTIKAKALINDDDGLEVKDENKITKNKTTKIAQFRESSTHIGRASEKRKIVKQMGIRFLKSKDEVKF